MLRYQANISLNIIRSKLTKPLNPEFMKKIRAQREQYKLNLEIPKSNQVSFGTESLCIQGSRVLNALPFLQRKSSGF